MLLLASQSPRRRQLLEQLGVSFTVQPQDIDESVLADEPPRSYVQRVARQKAEAALASSPQALILAADTSVIIDEQILGKPRGFDDAAAMLRLLAGRSHQVLSAITLMDATRQESRLCISEVEFRQIDDKEIELYWASGEPRGKAGAYAIQGYGAAFVKALRGSYSGVMGLPLFETAQLLDLFAVPRWQEVSTC